MYRCQLYNYFLSNNHAVFLRHKRYSPFVKRFDWLFMVSNLPKVSVSTFKSKKRQETSRKCYQGLKNDWISKMKYVVEFRLGFDINVFCYIGLVFVICWNNLVFIAISVEVWEVAYPYPLKHFPLYDAVWLFQWHL